MYLKFINYSKNPRQIKNFYLTFHLIGIFHMTPFLVALMKHIPLICWRFSFYFFFTSELNSNKNPECEKYEHAKYAVFTTSYVLCGSDRVASYFVRYFLLFYNFLSTYQSQCQYKYLNLRMASTSNVLHLSAL